MTAIKNRTWCNFFQIVIFIIIGKLLIIIIIILNHKIFEKKINNVSALKKIPLAGFEPTTYDYH